ncbi:MAG: hypothetical protein L0226_09090 [Acidobacteria bacterium]|nr:hypothetical protein [Acidobacteriota bacterium]
MRFDELSTYFERLEAVTGRLEMYHLLGELFHRANPDEAAEIAYLCEARLLPPFANLEMGMGERMTRVHPTPIQPCGRRAWSLAPASGFC